MVGPWENHLNNFLKYQIFFLNDYSGVFRPDFYSTLVPIRISQNFPEFEEKNCLKNFEEKNCMIHPKKKRLFVLLCILFLQFLIKRTEIYLCYTLFKYLKHSWF